MLDFEKEIGLELVFNIMFEDRRYFFSTLQNENDFAKDREIISKCEKEFKNLIKG